MENFDCIRLKHVPVGHTYLHHILYPKKNSIITSTGSSINSAVIYVYFIKSTACELIIDGGEIRYIKGIPAIPTIIRPIINKPLTFSPVNYQLIKNHLNSCFLTSITDNGSKNKWYKDG